MSDNKESQERGQLMGYMLPLRFIKVSTKRADVKQFDVTICATRIVAVMSTELFQARRAIHDEKKAGTLINACGTLAAKTAIFLDNGAVVSSPLSVRVIMNAIERSNEPKVPKHSPRLKIYDVEDEEPDEDEEDISEIDSLIDDEFYDDELNEEDE